MKKLALVLGSLLVVGAVASAKEVVPAPVAAPEVVERIVEKPVIVYRDREVTPAWRPNGSFDMYYRGYFNTEGNDASDTERWNGNDNYGRLQTVTNVNFTENQRINLRTRTYNNFGNSDSSKKADEMRIRYWYNNGKVFGDVNGAARVQFRQRSQARNNDSRKDIGIRYELDFANYLFNNDFIKTDYFRLAPRYTYKWDGGKASTDYSNELGIDFESYFSLPYGFAVEFNLYPYYSFASDEYTVDKGDKDKEFFLDAELYLYQTTNLFKSGRHSIDFLFEGGYDQYNFAQYKRDGERRGYELYAQPSVQYNFQATDYVNAYFQAGAEYRNWVITAESDAKNWRWQPFVTVGAKVNF